MKKYVYTLLFAFSSLFMAEAQQLFDLKRCIETGLEQNYSIRIIRNEQQISDNNATPGKRRLSAYRRYERRIQRKYQ